MTKNSAQNSGLAISNLKVVRDDFQLIIDECVMNPGEIWAIVGPSGSGKTTLLRSIAGLLEYDQGEITWLGKRIKKPSEQLIAGHEDIKLVHQDFDQMPFIKVYENLQKYILEFDDDTRKQKLERWMHILSIKELESRKTKTLSGGQMQRLAIAQALISEPEVVLMDEPFSSLDVELKERLKDDLRNLFRSSGMTAVFVLHDPIDALMLADHVLVMEDGKVVDSGVPLEVWKEPKSKVSAGLFGRINWFTKTEMESLFFTPWPGRAVNDHWLVRPHEWQVHQMIEVPELVERRFLGTHDLAEWKASGKTVWQIIPLRC